MIRKECLPIEWIIDVTWRHVKILEIGPALGGSTLRGPAQKIFWDLPM